MAYQTAILLIACLSVFRHLQSAADVSHHFTTLDVYPSPNTTGLGGWSSALSQAKDFISKLNLSEKAYMVTGVPGPCVGNIAPIARLDFDGLCLQDGPLAVRQADYVSVFPAGLSAAASWDLGLIYQRGMEMGSEFKGKGANIALSPVAGPLGKHALGGRNWEGFSPDPYLTAAAFAMTIRGMQNAGAQACAKHFIGNEQETQRNPSTTPSGKTIEAVSSNIDDRTMHELYLWPFADAVRAGVSAIMCSYNRLNQTYSCQNSKLLNGLLKEELGFQGYVMSDWQATHSGLSSIHAGLDMDMPGGLPSSENDPASYFGRNITTAIHNGSLSEARLNDMIARVMTPYFYLKQNSGYPTVDPASGALNSFSPQRNSQFHFILNGTKHRDVREDHATLIRNLGAASVVLLKNTNHTLPLSAPKVIGVFGNDAADFTDGLYPAGGFGYNIGTLAVGGGSGSGRFSYLVSPLEAIKARAAQDGSLVQYITDNVVATSAIGLGTIYPTPSVCLVFLKTFVTEGYDRTSYLADWDSSALVTSVAGICNNTVVIMHSGGTNVMPWAGNPNVTGIIAAHLPGQETGNSLVDILYGEVNPSGRLPYTIGYSAADWNAPIINVSITDATDSNAFQDDFKEGLMIDYRHFDSAGIKPRYEFGFGLSYTTFNVLNLTVQNVEAGGKITARPPKAPTQPGGNPTLYDVLFHATVTVSNTGSRAGQAVPQLYLSLPKSSTPSGTPVKVLRGFAKVSIEPSERAEVGFDLLRRDISYWDVVSQNWVVPKGEMTVRVGFSSRDLPLTATIRAR